MIIESRTPTRVDFAGSTFDLYPLYLFEDGGYTINCAVSIYSHVRLETRDDSKISIRSLDTGARLSAKDIDSIKLGGELDLVTRIIRFYRPKVGIDLTIRNEPPKGSGLGGSSALLIALSGALNRMNGTRISKERIIDLGANLEAQTIGIPTGKQDYYGAMYGGINAIWFGVEGARREPFTADRGLVSALNERIILSYTNESRFSGTNNWAMLKGYIEKSGNTMPSLRKIKEVAIRMRDSLKKGDLETFGRLLKAEWECRRQLAKGVSTPQIDRMVENARKSGAIASKLCGAGGGGCMITYVMPKNRSRVERALTESGATTMPYRIDTQGLKISVEK
jgi:D-glycero-alpha-D-manno-heptose-7-phosphate kinase